MNPNVTNLKVATKLAQKEKPAKLGNTGQWITRAGSKHRHLPLRKFDQFSYNIYGINWFFETFI